MYLPSMSPPSLKLGAHNESTVNYSQVNKLHKKNGILLIENVKQLNMMHWYP